MQKGRAQGIIIPGVLIETLHGLGADANEYKQSAFTEAHAHYIDSLIELIEESDAFGAPGEWRWPQRSERCKRRAGRLASVRNKVQNCR